MSGQIVKDIAERFRLHPDVVAYFLPESIRKSDALTIGDIKKQLTPAIAHQVEYNLRNIERGERILKEVARRIECCKGRKVLDVGCGIGGVLVAFGLAGYELHGIELNKDRIGLCKKNLEFNKLSADILDMDLCTQEIPETFDVVIFNSVIEHVSDPDRMLDRLARMLNPGGILVLGVANKDALGNIIADPHYGVFGLTLMPYPAAAKMYQMLVDKTQSYSVTEFYPIAWYINRLQAEIGHVDLVAFDPPRNWDTVPALFARVTQGYAETIGKQAWSREPILRKDFERRFAMHLKEAWMAYEDALVSGDRSSFEQRYLSKSFHMYSTKCVR